MVLAVLTPAVTLLCLLQELEDSDVGDIIVSCEARAEDADQGNCTVISQYTVVRIGHLFACVRVCVCVCVIFLIRKSACSCLACLSDAPRSTHSCTS